jgi:hypothetical protein
MGRVQGDVDYLTSGVQISSNRFEGAPLPLKLSCTSL